MPRWFHGLATIVIVVSFASPALCETVVEVKSASGRTFRGVIDSRTNDESLWLRMKIGSVQLQRPIDWQRIASAEVNGEAIDVTQFKSTAADLATPAPKTHRVFRPSTYVQPTPPVVSSVQSIRCEAWLANWDADSAPDGLALTIEAIDDSGQVVDARGTLEAELISIDYQPGYLASTQNGRVPRILGQWSQPWSASSATKLAFSSPNLEREESLSRYALLKIRLTIPGHGVFEQEIDGLRIRRFTPVGNALWR